MLEVFELCSYYDIFISQVDENIKSSALGLGDIIRLLSCIKYGLWDGPLYINLASLALYNNPLNYIEFRFRLIKDIVKYNDIPFSKIIFFWNKNNIKQKLFIDTINVNSIHNLKLKFNNSNLLESNEEYIVFHTKCRFHFDKKQVLEDLKIFEKYIRSLKTSYKIYILGEKQMQRTNFEMIDTPDIITQIYDILINLSNHNKVIDKTSEYIIDNLNYDNFIEDIILIQNAKYNIHFGDGGGMNLSMIFGKNNTIIYNRDMNKWNNEILKQENNYIFNNINQFIEKIHVEINGEITTQSIELRKNQREEEQYTIRNKLFQQSMDKNITNNQFKINKNVYFLCHGGLGDLFINCGAIRFLSFFYNKIYLFCPLSALKNIKQLFTYINIEFITYEKWYEKYNTDSIWPKLSEDWYITAASILSTNKKIEDIFDWQGYINHYPDLNYITNKEDAWHHWINFGKNEGRKSFEINIELELFDWRQYINHYPDINLITNKEDACHHWINFGKAEGRKYFEINNIRCIDIDADILVTGDVSHKYLDNYVSKEILSHYNNYRPNNKIKHSGLIDYCNHLKKSNIHIPWIFIANFYKDINFDLSIYLNYFYIHSTSNSYDLYKKISKYKIVFLHFMSSCGQSYIPDMEWPHIYGEEYLIINPDKNHYKQENLIKYELANEYLNLLITDYIDIILYATDIYVTDSCFFNIIYPLRLTERLEAENIIIYDRYYPVSFHAISEPINLSNKK